MEAQPVLDRRLEKRYLVSGKITATMTRQNENKNLTFIILDVSKHGLGIIFEEKIVSGELINVVLDLGKGTAKFTMSIRWVQHNSSEGLEGLFGEDNSTIYRCGLQIENDPTNLEEFFRKSDNVVLEDLY